MVVARDHPRITPDAISSLTWDASDRAVVSGARCRDLRNWYPIDGNSGTISSGEDRFICSPGFTGGRACRQLQPPLESPFLRQLRIIEGR
jgi:hypothetical protein